MVDKEGGQEGEEAKKGDEKEEQNEEEKEPEPTEEQLLMKKLHEQSFRTRNRGLVTGAQALEKATVIGLYFSASWCPPCKEFTPLLSAFYKELSERGATLQIIYLPYDKSEDLMWEYVLQDHGNWVIAPFEDAIIQDLADRYEVGSVPKLVVISAKGDLITKKARKEVTDKGVVAYRNWVSTSGALSSAQNRMLDDLK